jgi:hypothetical protein
VSASNTTSCIQQQTYPHDPEESFLSEVCFVVIEKVRDMAPTTQSDGKGTYGVGFVVGNAPGLPKVLMVTSFVKVGW